MEHLKKLHIATEHVYVTFGPHIASQLADTYLELVSALCLETRYGAPAAAQLCAAASDAATLCGWIAFERGNQARAQACYLTALRTASIAEDPEREIYALIMLAKQQIELSDPLNSVPLLDAARRVIRSDINVRVEALLESTSATASAFLGERTSFDRYTDAAFTAFATGSNDDAPIFTEWLTEDQLALMAGAGAAELGQAERALDWLEPVLGPAGAAPRVPPREAAFHLSSAGRAYLALGATDEAVSCTDSMVSFLADRPSCGIQAEFVRLRTSLIDHRHIPAALDRLERLGNLAPFRKS
ncbi:hypothetical protein GCM10010214_19990 [Streptomyces abikoensis]|nr:hypothetical protein GCM10010214_19990 [Streptomyces abikoensis]